MNASQKPLAKALHTVTVVARVAQLFATQESAERRALRALGVLGYTEEQARASGELFAACVKAVERADAAEKARPRLALVG